MYDEFAGFGGSSQGATAVPGVELILAANHLPLAVDVHALNFPAADHYLGDVAKADVTRFPRADLFWASPACPKWTNARGVKRDFDRTNQAVLFGPDGPERNVARSRALMEEVPRYLDAMCRRGRPVLAGVVENVIECRLWDQWPRWLGAIRALGYRTRVIALNSMHAAAPASARAPQSRDRLYVAYWHTFLGRDPDWDKWLRPAAWCPRCDQPVAAVQVFKRPGNDMGRYGPRGQYVYRCPSATCRHQLVDPAVVPALAALDLTLPGQRIGDRATPLAPATRARIAAGLRRYARPAPAAPAPFLAPLRSGRPRTIPLTRPLATVVAGGSNHALVRPGAAPVPPMLVPAGGTWNATAAPATAPMRTRTTRDTDALVIPAGNPLAGLLVPVEARDGVTARPLTGELRTQTGRAQDALVVPLRANGAARPAHQAPLPAFAAAGTHHALVMRNNTPRGDSGQMCTPAGEPLRALTTAGHQSLVTWTDPHVYAYDTGALRSAATGPLPAQTTVEGEALLNPGADPDVEVPEVDDCLFRMLTPAEIAAGMAFAPGYRVLGSKRDQVRGYGNAVTPPAAEIIVSALVEAITGEQLEPAR
jgi:DNA (cytosine-5)-methyltransferase 1